MRGRGLTRLAARTVDRLRAEAARAASRYSPTERSRRARFASKRRALYREHWAEAADQVGARLEPLASGYLRMRRGDTWTLVRGADVMLDDHLSLEMAGDKALTARLLAGGGFAVLPHATFGIETLDKASAFAREVGGPMVVKPASGTGAGRGVTTGIAGPAQLLQAARRARLFGPELLIEPQVDGASFRLLYIGGELVCAVRRDPPAVAGDGRSSIAHLCVAETEARLCAEPPTSLHPLELDLDARFHLAALGHRPASVPGKGEAVVVKRVSNQNARADNHVVFDSVHPTIAARGAEMVNYLGLDLAGVDVIAPSVSEPFDGRVVMNEVNTSPGLHHHVLVADPRLGRPVFARALELALQRSPRRLNKELAA